MSSFVAIFRFVKSLRPSSTPSGASGSEELFISSYPGITSRQGLSHGSRASSRGNKLYHTEAVGDDIYLYYTNPTQFTRGPNLRLSPSSIGGLNEPLALEDKENQYKTELTSGVNFSNQFVYNECYSPSGTPRRIWLRAVRTVRGASSRRSDTAIRAWP